jgi:hypothetical protein
VPASATALHHRQQLMYAAVFHTGLTSLKVSSAHGGYSGTNEKPGLSQDPLIQQPPSSKFSQGAQQGGQEVAQAAEGAGGAVTLGAAVGRMLECLPPR